MKFNGFHRFESMMNGSELIARCSAEASTRINLSPVKQLIPAKRSQGCIPVTSPSNDCQANKTAKPETLGEPEGFDRQKSALLIAKI